MLEQKLHKKANLVLHTNPKHRETASGPTRDKDDLAERAGMSSRHFTRAFIAEIGTTPSKAVERLRIEVARQRVQSSSEAIEHVAQSTGFRDPERMRRAFIRAFGQPPQSLRRAARMV